MKTFIFIISFFIVASITKGSFQQTMVPSNVPEIVDPIMKQWINDAEINGVDYKKRLSELKSINFVGRLDGFGGAEYYQNRITISVEKLLKDQDGSAILADIQWKIYHELGHHFNVVDCYQCKYNIMSGNKNERALNLYRDEWLEKWLDENYFEALKNPNSHNKTHTHR